MWLKHIDIEYINVKKLAEELKLKSDKKDDEKKLLKKKIERAQTTVKNTKENMK